MQGYGKDIAIMQTRRRSSCAVVVTDTALLNFEPSLKLKSLRLPKYPHLWNRIASGAQLLWCFAASDVKTMVFPLTMFGILSALAGEQLVGEKTEAIQILCRLPLVLLWLWGNVLLLSISNQRSPDSITEDKINKPWRPIPSGKINADQARQLLLAVAPAVMLGGAWMGISKETFWCLVGSWYYSDLGGGDQNWIMRQALNGIAYLAYGAGVYRLFAGPDVVLTNTFWIWLSILSIIVATTIQVQDLKDEEGDRLRDRNTAPLVFGSIATRWSVAIGVVFWSAACPLWWQTSLVKASASLILGSSIAYLVLSRRNQSADKKTFVLWGVWMISMFALPALTT